MGIRNFLITLERIVTCLVFVFLWILIETPCQNISNGWSQMVSATIFLGFFTREPLLFSFLQLYSLTKLQNAAKGALLFFVAVSASVRNAEWSVWLQTRD